MSRRIYWRRNPNGKGLGLNSGYLITPWFDLAYRGLMWPIFGRPIHIGSTVLYTLGPIGLFWKGKKS